MMVKPSGRQDFSQSRLQLLFVFARQQIFAIGRFNQRSIKAKRLLFAEPDRCRGKGFGSLSGFRLEYRQP